MFRSLSFSLTLSLEVNKLINLKKCWHNHFSPLLTPSMAPIFLRAEPESFTELDDPCDTPLPPCPRTWASSPTLECTREAPTSALWFPQPGALPGPLLAHSHTSTLSALNESFLARSFVYEIVRQLPDPSDPSFLPNLFPYHFPLCDVFYRFCLP